MEPQRNTKIMWFTVGVQAPTILETTIQNCSVTCSATEHGIKLWKDELQSSKTIKTPNDIKTQSFNPTVIGYQFIDITD